MKKIKWLLGLFIIICSSPVLAFWHGNAGIVAFGRSEVSLTNFGFVSEYPLINMFKNSNNWNHGDNSVMYPDEIDSNGWPLPGKAWTTHSGASNQINTPSQTDRPGHYVLTLTGQGSVSIFLNGTGSQTFVSCTAGNGRQSGFQTLCDNTACSTFTGSIAGTTLTVTAAPTGTGCGLGAGTPITGSGVTLSKFGTPTMITSSGSACGGNTCYTVNQSQTAASTTMQAGLRLELSVTVPFQTFQADTYVFTLVSTGTNYAQNFAFFHVGDETAYWNSASPCPGSFGQACITSSIFQTRIKQAGFGVLRDLDYIAANVTNCSVWSTRRPINYFSYGAGQEYRNAASGQGQYANSAGTGASGATVTYNAGTDNYNITLGSGNFQDKQSILWLPPANGTGNSTVSLNGNTPAPILLPYGSPLGGIFTPNSTVVLLSVYDAAVGGALTNNNGNTGAGQGFNCPVPPEIFIEMNAELKTTPWHVVPFYAMDPMTDWVKQYAAYIKANYPQVKPIFEVTNEPNNFITVESCYLSTKSRVWAAIDPTAWNQGGGNFCGSGGNVSEEVGKMASTTGQDLTTVYGQGNFELLAPTMPYLGSPSGDAPMLTSRAYVAQNTGLIPIQSGYSQTPAYLYETRISNNNYWNLGYSSVGGVGQGPRLRGIETALAYCYFNYSISAWCQGSFASQAAVMTQYFTSSTGLTSVGTIGNVTGTINALGQYITAAASCFTFSTRPAGCQLNQTSPMVFYEGGYSPNPVPKATNAGWSNGQAVFTNTNGDIVQPLLFGTNASQAVISVSNNSQNGCVPGMTINISGLAGGTWSGANGNYVVQSNTTTTCTINLNSSGLGTFGTVRTTATANWLAGSGTISVASCASVTAGQSIYDLTASNFIGYVSGCSGTTLSIDNDIDTAFAAFAGTNGDTLVFSSAQITYTGSFAWIQHLRNLSYTAPELDAATTSLYNGLVGIGGQAPSQYLMGAQGFGYFSSGSPWFVWATDVYGYYPVGSCTACTIASTTLTLGGTILGQFRVGDTLIGGGGITGTATGAGSNTTITSCTPVGSNVCGTTAGDTLGLSQASTVSIGQPMMGTIAAPTNNAGNGTTSPNRAWGAICRFNGNGNQCNGWLLKRDIDPASNDNGPIGLPKVA